MNRKPVTFPKVYYEKHLGIYPEGMGRDFVNSRFEKPNLVVIPKVKEQFGDIVLDAGYTARNDLNLDESIFFDVTTSRPLTPDELKTLNDCVSIGHNEVAKDFNEKALDDVGRDVDGVAIQMFTHNGLDKTPFTVKEHSYPRDNGFPEFLDAELGYNNGHELSIMGDNDDNFKRIDVRINKDASFGYIYMTDIKGFSALPAPFDPLMPSNGPEAKRFDTALSEFYDVYNVCVFKLDSDTAAVSFRSKELLDVYAVAEKIEDIRMESNQDFADAIASIPVNNKKLEQ